MVHVVDGDVLEVNDTIEVLAIVDVPDVIVKLPAIVDVPVISIPRDATSPLVNVVVAWIASVVVPRKRGSIAPFVPVITMRLGAVDVLYVDVDILAGSASRPIDPFCVDAAASDCVAISTVPVAVSLAPPIPPNAAPST